MADELRVFIHSERTSRRIWATMPPLDARYALIAAISGPASHDIHRMREIVGEDVPRHLAGPIRGSVFISLGSALPPCVP